jgi:RNA recognition motif-containing protein
MNKDIYVKNLAPDMTEDDLKKLFSVVGRVQSITLVTDPKPGQAKGTAYVTMATSDEAKDAVNTLDGTRFLNKIIRVVESRPKRLGVVGSTERKAPKAKSGKKQE